MKTASAAGCLFTLPEQLASQALFLLCSPVVRDEFPQAAESLPEIIKQDFIKEAHLRSTQVGKGRQQDLTARVPQRLPHRYISLYALLDSIMKYPSFFQSRNSKVVFFCVLSLTSLTNRMISQKQWTLGARKFFGVVEYILKSIFSLMFLFLIKRLCFFHRVRECGFFVWLVLHMIS